MNTSIETLKHSDWDQLEADVVTRIRAIKAIVNGLDSGNPLNDQIANELILPAVTLLGEFCQSVQLEQETTE